MAVSKAIAAVNAGFTHEVNGYNEEIRMFGDCVDTEEMKEGVAAFLEKRKANFRKRNRRDS